MSMKRYSESCSFQQCEYVPAVNTYLTPHHMANDFYEPWLHQWTNTDLEHNISPWQMCHDNDDHIVARTSAPASMFAVGFGSLPAARRRLNKRVLSD